MPKDSEETKYLSITVTLLPDGNINVNGPLEQKILCLGLLEAGKAAVLAHKSSGILTPSLPKGFGRG